MHPTTHATLAAGRTPTLDDLFARRPTVRQLAVVRALFATWPQPQTHRQLLARLPGLKTPSAVTKRLANLRRRVRPEHLERWDEVTRRARRRPPSLGRRVRALQGSLLENV
jgi:hypothetical protein